MRLSDTIKDLCLGEWDASAIVRPLYATERDFCDMKNVSLVR